MLTRTRRDLAGPPFALPAVLDRVSERWWRTGPRARAWIGVAATALIVVAGMASLSASPHGPPAYAWVASDDLPVGHVIAPGDLRRATWPRELLPDGALEAPDGTLAAPLPRGAIATDGHLGDAGVAAGLPAGTVAVPVPIEVLPDLPAGARLDLVSGGLSGEAHRLATGATVLHVDGAAVWLGVDAADASRVAAAVLHGPVGVIVLPH